MWVLGVFCLIWLLYEGFREKKKADKEVIEYEKQKCESLGLPTRGEMLERICSKR